MLMSQTKTARRLSDNKLRRRSNRYAARFARKWQRELERCPTPRNAQTPCVVLPRSDKAMRDRWMNAQFRPISPAVREYITRRVTDMGYAERGNVFTWSYYPRLRKCARWVRRVLVEQMDAFEPDPMSEAYGCSSQPYLVPGRRAIERALTRARLNVEEFIEYLQRCQEAEQLQNRYPRAFTERTALDMFFGMQ